MQCATELTPLYWSSVNYDWLKLVEMTGAEGGSRTRTPLRTTDFKSVESGIT